MRKLNKNRDVTRAGYTFLKQFQDPRNYFIAKYVDDKKNWYPVQTICNIVTKPKRFKSIKLSRYCEHITGDPNKALGYNNSPNTNNQYHLYCLDIDFHRYNKTLAERAKQLIRKILGDAFYEPSTNYKGLHGYLVVNKNYKSAKYMFELMSKLEKILTNMGKKIGLKAIEIMGKPHLYKWENNEIVDVQFSTPAKLPISADLTELANRTPLDVKVIEKFVWEHEEKLENIPEENKSNGFKYHGFSKVLCRIQTDVLNEWGTDKQKLGRRYVHSSHLSVFIYLLWLFKKKRVDYVSHELIKFHWQELYRRGLIDMAYNKEIVIWCRNYISSKGMIEWIDNRYCKSVITEDGEVIVEGVCCAFKLDNELFKMLGGKYGHTSESIFNYFWDNEHKVPVYDSELRKEKRFCHC